MALTLDPEIAAVLAPMLEAAAGHEPPPVGDIEARRAVFATIMAGAAAADPAADDVQETDFALKREDGGSIMLRWYGKDGGAQGPAALYLHGGGMIMGDVPQFDATVSNYVSRSGVPMLSVDYRVAPEHPHPTPVEDCYAGLVWLAEHADELGVDPARVAVMGDSAGGGIAAAVTLMARDRGAPRIARQLLIYPMLDDRTTVPDPEIVPYAAWTYDDNVTAWSALLGDDAGAFMVPDFAAPARMEVAGLPPAYVEIGELDIFRDETIEYTRRMARAGVSTELHVRPGAPHEFAEIAPASDVGRRAQQDRIRALQEL